MFSRFFSSAAEVLTQPGKSTLELVKENWESIIISYETTQKALFKDTSILETSIPANLSTILKLVREDEATRTRSDSSFPSCLDFLLQERALSILVEYAIKDILRGFRMEITQFFSELISLYPKKILPHLSARRPLIKLVYSFLLKTDESVMLKEAHINLLLAVITTLNQNPELLGLFTALPANRTRRSSSVTEPVKLNLNNKLFKMENCAPVQIFLVSLQNYLCSSGSIGIHARGALFELIHLLSSDIESTDLLIKDPSFKNIMLEQLTFLFTSMPTNFSRRKRATTYTNRHSLTNIQLTAIERSQATMDCFFELWKFLNKLVHTTRSLFPKISEYILESILDPFLHEVVCAGFLHESPAISCSRIMYYLDMITESSSPGIISLLLNLILDNQVPIEINGDSKKSITMLSFMIQRIHSDDDEISLVALQFFDAFLSIANPRVYSAIIPGLLSNTSTEDVDGVRRKELTCQFLDLTVPYKRDLRTDIQDFLVLLNSPQNGHDQYILDGLFSGFGIGTNLPQSAIPSSELSLSPFLTALFKELNTLAERSYERIFLIMGIFIKLLRLPNSKLDAMVFDLSPTDQSDGDRPGNDTAPTPLIDSITKALTELESRMVSAGDDLWNIDAIESAYIVSTPTSPHSPSPSSESSLNPPPSPYTRTRSMTSPSSPFRKDPPPTPTPDALPPPTTSSSPLLDSPNPPPTPRLRLPNPPFPHSHPTSATHPRSGYPKFSPLKYVTHHYKPLFMQYVTLQEICKELAAHLTIGRLPPMTSTTTTTPTPL